MEHILILSYIITLRSSKNFGILMQRFLPALIFLLLVLYFPANSEAQWEMEGLILALNTSDDRAWGACADDDGGFWYAYIHDDGVNYFTYLQRVNSEGYFVYPGYGLTVVDTNMIHDTMGIEGVTSDGAGGVIIGMMNYTSNGDLPFGPRAQRFNSNGERLWGNGVYLAYGLQDWGLHPNFCSDGNGGAYAAFFIPAEAAIEVQRVTNDGILVYPEENRPRFYTGVFAGIFPNRDCDGVFAVGRDPGNGDTIKVGHSDASGEVTWFTEVRNISNFISSGSIISATQTLNERLWVAWGLSGFHDHVAATLLDVNGDTLMTPVMMFTDLGDNPNFSRIVCDGDGNGYVMQWNTSGANEVNVAKIDQNGDLPWGANGVPVWAEDSDYVGYGGELYWDNEHEYLLCPFGVMLYDPEADYYYRQMFVQSFSSDGERLWGEEGLQLTALGDLDIFLFESATIKTSDGAYVLISTALRPSNRYMLIASKFYHDGTVAWNSAVEETRETILSEWKILNAYPNPFNSSVSFHIQRGSEPFSLKIYDITGRLVHDAEFHRGQSGTMTYAWQPSPSLSSGIYFAKIYGKNKSAIKKVTLIK